LQYFKIENKIENCKTLIIEKIKKKIINIVKNIFKFKIKQKQLNILNIALKKNIIIIAKIEFEKILLYQILLFIFLLLKTTLIIIFLLVVTLILS